MTDNADNKAAKDTQALTELENKVNAESATTAKKQTTYNKQAVSTPPKQPAKAKTGLLWFVSLFTLVLLLASVGAGYWLWQQWNHQRVSQSELLLSQKDMLEQKVAAIEQNNASVASQNSQLLSRIDSLSEQLQSAIEQSNANASKLAEVSGRRPADWLLAEADYLVRMAGRKMWLEHDVKTALLMLKSADSRLQDLADPSLIPVRQLLANDIQTLQQVNPISLSSVALAISGMLQQIDSLPLALPKLPEIQHNEEQVSGSVSDWKANLNKLWAFFVNDLVRYQPREQPIRPLLSVQQQWLARQQLKYTLLQAQSSVLMENAALYQQNISQALTMLVKNFDLEHVAVEQFVASLQNLKQTNIERVYPPLLQAAQPLKDLLQQRIEGAFVNQPEPL